MNHTDYKIHYDYLDVKLESGTIIASGIQIQTLRTQNPNTFSIQGKIDSLEVDRLEIWNALFNREITISNIKLVRPYLDIYLKRPESSSIKKQTKIALNNVTIKNGEVRIFRHTKKKLASIQALNLHLRGLEISKDSKQGFLPFNLKEYHISGTNLFIRPHLAYTLKINHIDTHSQSLNLQNLELIPLLKHEQFARYFPEKRQYIEAKIKSISLDKAILKNREFVASELNISNPKIKIHLLTSSKIKKKNDKKYNINLHKLGINQGAVEIYEVGTSILSARDLTLETFGLKMNNDSTKTKTPISFQSLTLGGRDLIFKKNEQNIQLKQFDLSPKYANIHGLSVHSKASKTSTGIQLDIPKTQIRINDWKLIESGLKLDVQSLLVADPKVAISIAEHSQKKQNSYNGIAFPMTIRQAKIQNARVQIRKGESHTTIHKLSVSAGNLSMDDESVKKTFPFNINSYIIQSQGVEHKINRFYRLTMGDITAKKNQLNIQNFTLKPLVSRAKFIRMIPSEKDLYHLSAQKISIHGRLNIWDAQPSINAEQVQISGLDANIFRSKIPKDDTSIKPMYSELLRSLKFPLLVKNLNINGATLMYEEDTKKSDGPGALSFTNLAIKVKNLSSLKAITQNTLVPITIDCYFMGSSPMHVDWTIDPAQKDDAFSIKGMIRDLPAKNINPFVEPYLNIRTTGYIERLGFDLNGNKKGIEGKMNMQHENLKIVLLKKSGEKNKFLSSIANLFIRSNTKGKIHEATIETVERDPTKSFFNLFWKGIEAGLKKHLLSSDVNKKNEKKSD